MLSLLLTSVKGHPSSLLFTMPQSKLFTPLAVNSSVHLQHRIVLAPLTRYKADEVHVPFSPLVKEYYSQRANTAGSLLITEGTFIAPKAGGLSNVPEIWSDAQIAAWKEITASVHVKGSFIFMQLWALGRSADYAYLQREDPSFPYISASDVAPASQDSPPPRPMTVEEIKEYAQLYAQAAKNAIEAGFDGVEVHSANGCLPDQFLQPVTNKRTDAYGGSIENRSRFVLEIIDAIVNAVGAHQMGMPDPVPQFSHVISALATTYTSPPLAYLHLIEPRVHGNVTRDPTTVGVHESNDAFRAVWRSATTSTGKRIVLVAGGLTKEVAEQTLGTEKEEEGEHIATVFGRHFIANDMPNAGRKAPYPADFDWAPHLRIPDSIEDYTLSTMVRNKTAAAAQDPEVPDVGRPLRPAYTISPEEIQGLTRKAVYDAHAPLSPNLAQVVDFMIQQNERAPGALLQGGLQSIVSGLTTAGEVPIPEPLVAAVVARRSIALQAYCSGQLRRFNKSESIPTKPVPLACLNMKPAPVFDSPAWLSRLGFKDDAYTLVPFENAALDALDALENLKIIAEWVTSNNGTPGSRLGLHVGAHVTFVKAHLAPPMPVDKWFKFSVDTVEELIAGGKSFDKSWHQTFVQVFRSQSLLGSGDKRPPDFDDRSGRARGAPRPRPANWYSQPGPVDHQSPWAPPPGPPPPPYQQAAFGQQQHQQHAFGQSSYYPAPTASSRWSQQQQQPGFGQQQQQQGAPGAQNVVLTGGNAVQQTNMTFLCPICGGPHRYTEHPVGLTHNANGAEFFARAAPVPGSNASSLVSVRPTASHPAGTAICVAFNIFGRCTSTNTRHDAVHIRAASPDIPEALLNHTPLVYPDIRFMAEREYLRSCSSNPSIRDSIVTPYDADAFERALVDLDLTDEFPFLVENLRNGFPIGDMPELTRNIIMNNGAGADEHPKTAEYVESELAEGRISGPFETEAEVEAILGGHFVCSPLIIATSEQGPGKPPKDRVCRHLSKVDKRTDFPSVNAYVEKEKFPTTFDAAERIAETIAHAPADTTACSFDLKSFHRTIPVHPLHKRFIVFKYRGKYYIDHCHPFGLASASSNAGQVGGAIGRIWTRRMEKQGLARRFEDDFSKFVFRWCKLSFEQVKGLVDDLRAPWNLEKSGTAFEKVFVSIGFLWDVAGKRVSLPDAKREKYIARLRDALSGRKITLHDLQRVFGTLIHISFVYCDGSSRLPAISNSFHPYHDDFEARHLTRSAREAIEWWLGRLLNPHISRPLVPLPPLQDLRVFVDASTSWGIGILIGEDWYALRFALLRLEPDICWLEAVALRGRPPFLDTFWHTRRLFTRPFGQLRRNGRPHKGP
ncbi:hypothetical protein MKEN_00314000 [Mycena kentingensis (nom. inval.)]|nr:hypothetical protein MKEN_00314000 [Mycena kentingensis (nom. inval.)]